MISRTSTVGTPEQAKRVNRAAKSIYGKAARGGSKIVLLGAPINACHSEDLVSRNGGPATLFA
jgi:hypothetical protein